MCRSPCFAGKEVAFTKWHIQQDVQKLANWTSWRAFGNKARVTLITPKGKLRVGDWQVLTHHSFLWGSHITSSRARRLMPQAGSWCKGALWCRNRARLRAVAAELPKMAASWKWVGVTPKHRLAAHISAAVWLCGTLPCAQWTWLASTAPTFSPVVGWLQKMKTGKPTLAILVIN